jgi:hypothetical protein
MAILGYVNKRGKVPACWTELLSLLGHIAKSETKILVPIYIKAKRADSLAG